MRSSCDVSLGYHNVDGISFVQNSRKKKDQLVNSNLQIHGFDGFNLGKNLLSNVLETYEFIKILKKSMFSLSHFLQWNENLIDYRGGDVEEAWRFKIRQDKMLYDFLSQSYKSSKIDNFFSITI